MFSTSTVSSAVGDVLTALITDFFDILVAVIQDNSVLIVGLAIFLFFVGWVMRATGTKR